MESALKLDCPRLAGWIVGNCTNDGGGRRAERLPSARVIRLADDLGYSGGHNVGLSLARDHQAQYVLLLNNFTVVSLEWLLATQCNGNASRAEVLLTFDDGLRNKYTVVYPILRRVGFP